MDQHHDDFLVSTQKATDKGRFLKLPRYQKKIKYNFDGLVHYSNKTAHLDLPTRAIIKLGMWSPTSTTQNNYTRASWRVTMAVRN